MTTHQNNHASAEERLFEEFPHPSYEEWRRMVEKQLKGVPFEHRLVTHTYEGIAIQPIYRQEDIADLPHLDSLPGFPPYVRGRNLLGHVRRPWAVAQELPYRTPAEFNRSIRADLERGQTMVNMVFDRATLFGRDPDEADMGDVGRGGLSIATVDDLARALYKVNLEETPIFLQATSAALPITALLMALVRRQGISPTRLRGCIGMDSLHTLVSTGSFPRSLQGAYDRMANLIGWVQQYAPHMRVVNVHSQAYHDGGANAVQELAFAAATGVEYIRALLQRGLTIDEIATRFCFSFSVGTNIFMEIAKLRAARLLWARIVAAFGGSESAQRMAVHVRTSSWNKTIYDPYVNMLRTTVEAFAGVAGGADSLHVGPFDEPLGLPDEFSRRIARNTQLILLHESQLNRVIDPAGGSWYVEKLTDELARKAWALFQEVEKRGGMAQALQDGFPQAEVARTADQRLKNIATRKDVFIGTNVYPNLDEKPLEVMQVDYEDLHARRSRYVAQYRTSMDSTRNTLVMQKLNDILNARGPEAIEAAIEAALAGATLGEIAHALRTGDETPITIQPIPAQRGAEMFEALRAASDVHAVRTGARPRVFLANLGPVAGYKPRADFAADFFQVGGFEVVTNDGFPTVPRAVKAALESEAQVIVVCGPNEVYPPKVPRLARAIKRKQPNAIVIVAGRPDEHREKYRAAGVDGYIYNGIDVYDTLLNLQRKLGIV
ncbi:MAG: methylmalonyl-CoA mutase, partial [Chloroflexi bacterium]